MSTLQAKRGALKDCPADDMLAAVLQATVDRTGVDPAVCGLAYICQAIESMLNETGKCSI